jgi:ParB family transcriptional regulator, chromosome partitioning protein
VIFLIALKSDFSLRVWYRVRITLHCDRILRAMKLLHLPVGMLRRGRFQPRQNFDTQSLNELAESIRQQGLIEPLIVQEIKDGQFEVIAGERRWRAAMLVGLPELPCLLGRYSDDQAAAVSLIENLQREDLNALEEAKAYQKLRTNHGYSQETIASLVSKSRSHITNMMRLLHLSEYVQDRILENVLSFGHARTLVGLSPQVQRRLADTSIRLQWSVRQLEQAVKLHKQQPIASSERQRTSSPSPLGTQLAEHLGTPVDIQSEKQGGWINIRFYDNETLEGILQRMGITVEDH